MLNLKSSIQTEVTNRFIEFSCPNCCGQTDAERTAMDFESSVTDSPPVVRLRSRYRKTLRPGSIGVLIFLIIISLHLSALLLFDSLSFLLSIVSIAWSHCLYHLFISPALRHSLNGSRSMQFSRRSIRCNAWAYNLLYLLRIENC